MSRGNYLPAPHAYNLHLACCVVVEAYGPCVYLVGSCLEKRDYRDVDVRAILADEDFDRRFPKLAGGAGPFQFDPEWSLACASISLWLEQRTGLPIDFQIQRQTQANEEESSKARWALGLFRAAPANPDMFGNAKPGERAK